ncbi:Endomembrane protein 70-domain-containing protein [Mucor mucedo]|uniref:Endomembrane protein 70-domain-containing protein n=1 Tax=Mucor mucedo TaxID=29922 RepID=UPI002220F5C6|nr:Endomembrane protein 70-domain-containing protein [Mucor mucedo]KAI7891986.1 Endomembrane protein 70-domain-containing protein [Mucor mucedo]
MLTLGRNTTCNALCSVNLNKKELNFAKALVQMDYQMEWIMPATSASKSPAAFFDLGYYDTDSQTARLYNHFDIRLSYTSSTKSPKNKYIVGFQVQPLIKYEGEREFKCNNTLYLFRYLGRVIGLMLIRLMRRDTNIRNRINNEELSNDHEGWKYMYGDMFQPPSPSMWLGPLLGSGIQLINMTFFSLFLVPLLGFLDPAYQEGLVSYGISLCFLSGLFSGYISTLTHNLLGVKTRWITNAFVTLFFVPTIIFLMIFVINMAALYESSLFAISRSSLIYMIMLWFLISTPLVFLGAYVCEKNYRQHKISHDSSVLISQIPKQRTGHLWYFQPMFRDPFFCLQDYKWWWKSFYISFVSSVCVFIGLVITVPTVIYLGYSFITCAIYGLCMGTIGFFSSYCYVRNIYASIKVGFEKLSFSANIEIVLAAYQVYTNWHKCYVSSID